MKFASDRSYADPQKAERRSLVGPCTRETGLSETT
jgi:hypothetical protein